MVERTSDPVFRFMLAQAQSWERGSRGNILHRDPYGTLTNYGLIHTSLRDAYHAHPEFFQPPDRWAGLRTARTEAQTEPFLAMVDAPLAYQILRSRYLGDRRIDTLPLEIQANVFDMGLTAGPGRSVQLLHYMLIQEGYMPGTRDANGLTREDLSGLKTKVDDTLRQATEQYLADHGMVRMNNRFAELRIDYYESLEKLRNELPGWRRRGATFIMSESKEEYRRRGFEVDAQGRVFLPDGMTPEWYNENVLAGGYASRASFNASEQAAIGWSAAGAGAPAAQPQPVAGAAPPPRAQPEGEGRDEPAAPPPPVQARAGEGGWLGGILRFIIGIFMGEARAAEIVRGMLGGTRATPPHPAPVTEAPAQITQGAEALTAALTGKIAMDGITTSDGYSQAELQTIRDRLTAVGMEFGATQGVNFDGQGAATPDAADVAALTQSVQNFTPRR